MMALMALGLSGVARAADAPMPVMQGAPGAQIPQGWVWQGVFQDGRWSGQWVPGPGMGPGMMPPPLPQVQPMMPPAAMDCGKHHHDCGAMPPPMPYAPMGYGPMMGPMMMGWTWVPVQTQPQQPCVETRTTTVTYEYDHHRRVIPPRPHHHDKRVYTGS